VIVLIVITQGPVLACLHAVEAFQKSGQQLPVNLKVSVDLVLSGTSAYLNDSDIDSQTYGLIMVALCNRADHYIFAL